MRFLKPAAMLAIGSLIAQPAYAARPAPTPRSASPSHHGQQIAGSGTIAIVVIIAALLVVAALASGDNHHHMPASP